MKTAGTGVWRMWTGRRWLFLLLLVVFVLCVDRLGTRVISHAPGADPWSTAADFFKAAFSPSFVDENPSLPDEAEPFLSRLGADLLRTLRYALIATAMAIPLGFVLGILASKQWWPAQGPRFLLQMVRWPVRLFLSLMRSIHEIIWAIFFLSAFGAAPMSACLALALPFAGTLAKVYSELIDEQNRSARQVITGCGGSSLQGFLAGVLPTALPDMITYSLYRFECALRSSAVLGFIGIETVGLTIHRSFENLYFGEVWTGVYALIITVLLIEGFGYLIRRRLTDGKARTKEIKELSEAHLRRVAPRDRLLRFSGLACVVLVLAAFNFGPQLIEPMENEKRMERLSRFASKITPDPVAPAKSMATWSERKEAWSENAGELGPWVARLWHHPGKVALLNTVVLSVAAIILAGVGALLCVPWASRNLASRRPVNLSMRGGRWFVGLGVCVRFFFVLTRAVPEYLYAFLLVGLLGPSAWPLVFALALHNVGILGRLWSEVVENQPTSQAKAVMQIGGSRLQGFAATLFPMSLNRFLLFFFYRWESCLREATVLGMLGISSLGYYISIQQNFLEYDDMLFFTLLGAGAIIIGDLLSDVLRSRLRNS